MNKEETLKAWTHKFILWILGCMGFMVLIYLMAISFYPIPEANNRIVDTTQGFLMGTVLNTVISIYNNFLLPKKEERDETGTD